MGMHWNSVRQVCSWCFLAAEVQGPGHFSDGMVVVTEAQKMVYCISFSTLWRFIACLGR